MKKLVIFDFDGVLANTEKFCFRIHKEVNEDLTWGKWQDLCLGNFIDSLNKKRINKIPDFYEKYEKEISKININKVLYKAILQLSDDYILSIVSSTDTQYIRNFLEKENVEKIFSDILGADVHKDKSFKINTLLDKYKVSSEHTVFITDTVGDIFEANKCNIKSIGVTWGLHQKETLAKGDPVAIIDDPRDLMKEIQNVLK